VAACRHARTPEETEIRFCWPTRERFGSHLSLPCQMRAIQIPCNTRFCSWTESHARGGLPNRSKALLGEGDGVGGGRIVGNGGSRLAIRLDGFIFLVEFLVRLAEQALNERIVLIGLEQFLERGLVILPVKRGIAPEIREELRLLWICAFVEDGFGGSDVVLRFGQISAPRGDARLRVLPAKVPQIYASGLDVGFFQPGLVTNLVPMQGGIQVAGIDANACGFIGDFALLEEILLGDE